MYISYTFDYFSKAEVLELISLVLNPIVLFGYYLFLTVSCSPSKEEVKTWHLSYSIPFAVIWFVSYFLNMLILVFAPVHSESIRFVGGGISFYGFTALIGFSIFAFIVQGFRFLRKSKDKEE